MKEFIPKRKSASVLFVGREIPDSRSMASEAVFFRHFLEIQNLNFEVILSVPGKFTFQPQSSVFKVIQINERKWWWPPMRFGWPDSVWTRVWARSISSTPEASRADVIISHLHGRECEVARLVARSLSKPLTLFIHDSLYHAPLPQDSITKILQHSTHCWCVSDLLTSQAIKRGARSASTLLPVPSSWRQGEIEFPTELKKRKRNIAIAGTLYQVQKTLPLIAYVAKQSGYKLTVITSNFPKQIALPENAQTIPFFDTAEDCGHYLRNECDAFVVPYPIVDGECDHSEYFSASFPSRVVEFARTGVPFLIVARESFDIATWCREKAPLSIATTEDEIKQWFLQLQCPKQYAEMTKQALTLAKSEFAPATIQEQFVKELQAIISASHLYRPGNKHLAINL